MLNYLGQGALVLLDPSTQANPFFRMIPAVAYWPVLALTTAATVIASQAVITGAYSMTQQAVQLGLVPRLDIKRTSETVAGQIFVPQVNLLLMVGVLLLLAVFKSSSNLASAYGIAVTATMVTTVLLLFVIERHKWRWPLWVSVAVSGPFLLIDMIFFSANAVKFVEGGWFPVVLGLGLIVVMGTWVRGVALLNEKARRESVPLMDLIQTLGRRPPHRVSGTAIFLTSEPDVAPAALMHNLKHNRMLHENNIILTVRTADTPRVPEKNRVVQEPINADFSRVTLTFGFMETPDVAEVLKRSWLGPQVDMMSTSFFLGRRSIVLSTRGAMPSWQHRLFGFLMTNATDPTDFFHIPADRVVQLGSQMTV
jgi:KUP system potassium uptake protein